MEQEVQSQGKWFWGFWGLYRFRVARSGRARRSRGQIDKAGGKLVTGFCKHRILVKIKTTHRRTRVKGEPESVPVMITVMDNLVEIGGNNQSFYPATV